MINIGTLIVNKTHKTRWKLAIILQILGISTPYRIIISMTFQCNLQYNKLPKENGVITHSNRIQ